MSCQYCQYALDTIHTWKDVHIFCYNCGHENPKDTLQVKYKYKNKGEHTFKIMNEFKCMACDYDICTLVAPCGGSYYFNESEISESLLVPQEFIIKK